MPIMLVQRVLRRPCNKLHQNPSTNDCLYLLSFCCLIAHFSYLYL
ncbi:hypothetical protein Patl1_00293 [Pistacia atlantica]|uniref:Uncharacterized protein n=1 Tax=Pistacia atlantica TaxID=434234 RepID=A0ACC1CAV7_9ROSI|nr:hypothetical protein Patl1_00293 [Pistacia atlantica]